VSSDGTSLYHEARAAGVIDRATVRRELHQSMGFDWSPVDPSTGITELAGVDRRDSIVDRLFSAPAGAGKTTSTRERPMFSTAVLRNRCKTTEDECRRGAGTAAQIG
jgi:hypothetical protein